MGNKRELILDLITHRHDGTLKLFVIWQALMHRQRYPDVYESGTYIPIAAVGRRQDNALVPSVAWDRIAG